MDQQERSRWQPTRRQLLWAGGTAAALAFLIIVVCGYLFEWKWTGFPRRTVWDWLELLIVPVVPALGGYLFTRSENTRTQEAAQQQRALDQKIADQRAQTDRVIAAQRREDNALQAYLDHIGGLLLYKDKPLRNSKEGDEVRALARARTITVLATLDDYL